tara:strand:+ start:2638 stop:3576 length:939 start_codon:yes stop_codon:yes gene_type:complete
MLISVILNCLNGEKFLKRSIESVLNQTFDVFEIVFIDNGSLDLSGEIAKAYGSKISYYRNEVTSPLGQARDQGIMLAKGDLIAFIDADDMWKSDKIENQIKLFGSGASFVFSNAEMSEGQGKKFILFDYAMPRIDYIFNSLLEKDFITTSSVMFKKDLYINSNEKYNKNLTIECDRDLFIRLSDGCNVKYTEDVLVTRYLHNSSTSVRRTAASIKELFYLEDSINNFSRNRAEDCSPSLDIFNSRLNFLKARHYWQLGDLKNTRLSFLKSSRRKINLLLILTYIYPFKSSLRPLLFLLTHLKYLSNFFKRRV